MTVITVADAYRTKPDVILTTYYSVQRVVSIEKQNENWYRICTIAHPHGFSVDKGFILTIEDKVSAVPRLCVVCGTVLGDMVPRQQRRCFQHQRFHRRMSRD